MDNIKNTRKKTKPAVEEEPIIVASTDTASETAANKSKKKATVEIAADDNWRTDGRLKKIIGLAMMVSAILMAFSFTSYLLTYTDDASELSADSLQLITQSGTTVKNSGGSIGAIVSDFFIQRLFGVASYFLCVILFMWGVNFFFLQPIFKTKRNTIFALIAMFWCAALMGFVNYMLFPESAVNLGGGFGNFLNGKDGIFMRWIKPVGIIALLASTALALAIWVYNIDFAFLLSIFDKKETETNSFPQENTTTDYNPEQLFHYDEPNYKDESENIFGKDNLADIKNEFKPKANDIPPTTPEIEIELNENTIIADEEIHTTKHELEIAENEEENVAAIESVHTPNLSTPFDPTQELSHFQFPSLELLDDHGGEKIKYNPQELEANKNQIISTLNNYQIEIDKIKATIGPTVTLYEIVPAKGVRISKIKNLEDDIALSLAALGIRIIAPIPGKGTIGIEVPNVNKEIVSMRSLLMSDKFQHSTADLPICLGKSISNEIVVADLAKMPHLLMAGATGQGKSVGINSILVSLLYKKHPSQLKFVMVDPKKVELSLYETLEKHYLAKLPGEEDAIITDTKKVVTTLNALCLEMDNRYELLKKAQVRNIKEYNHKFINRQLNPQNGHEFLPYIVLVVDEFADLIMTAGKEVEMPIARLAQLARAIGIHLILATQRPSVNIITGTIKANFPARIAFKTTSKIDSRTILDTGGSEQLIGRGDMLLSQGSDLIRLQCGFVDTPEIEKIKDFISNQQGFSQAFMLPEYIDPKEDKGGDDFMSDGLDPMFEDAARLIVQNQMGSTSLIQRRLKLGYSRAGRLMDQLEAAGIVGENVGSKAREVKVKTEMELEQFLQRLKHDTN